MWNIAAGIFCMALSMMRICGVAGSAKSARSLMQLPNCARTPTNGGGTPICRDVR
ncbi:hypothetical protein PF005_g8856 [Phytophthora fragariae]|uniref:RxLR effector protein n=1 Tax=Phytophthora fragariae TaxID=53985 RepID=A0A6A3YDX6_9STRA|nr:hypothetical protein PF003_g25120 [Phytophthora fragariae]KAE8940878.1 hypothetical protein PF009_g9328 [Phytophthora fragariae]KAE8989071.1 hypothetical protein PF011_g18924 [Phytophthora fragariae]KAE9101565.1 hypothetical protein PF010_g14402 [Phytophthora fragariae]KAE9112173.1 hypothetical protein PF007_g11206 [Phytophthora fragariae]